MEYKLPIRNKFYSSICAGFVGTLISHPIDTLKTNQQISGQKLKDIITTFSKNSNNIKSLIKNYYRGISYPLLFIPLEKGIVFNTDNYLYQKVNNRLLSGLGAGLIAGFFVNFIENFKINQQNIVSKNVFLDKKLSLKLFTNGLGQTIFREGLGYMIYFKSYHDFYRVNLPSFIAGSLAGITAWIIIYPFDRIKTLVQSGNSTKGINIYNIYRGCSLSLVRAGLLHGSVFYLMELINKF